MWRFHWRKTRRRPEPTYHFECCWTQEELPRVFTCIPRDGVVDFQVLEEALQVAKMEDCAMAGGRALCWHRYKASGSLQLGQNLSVAGKNSTLVEELMETLEGWRMELWSLEFGWNCNLPNIVGFHFEASSRNPSFPTSQSQYFSPNFSVPSSF